MMDLNLLTTLVAVAETGNLTRAGQRLGLTQPAVHHQLARLAESVGRPLYVREGRGLRLTAAGRRLAALGRTVGRATEVAMAELRGSGRPLPVIAAGRSTWRDRVVALPPCRPWVCDGPRALAAVRDGDAQLGIAALSPPPDLASRVVAQSEACVVVAADDPLAHASSVTYADLTGRAFVLPPPGRPVREAVAARIPNLEVTVEADGWDVLQRFVALGAGITVINTGVALLPGVVAVTLEDAMQVTYRAFWREDVDATSWVATMFPKA
ncbi:MAG: LysR family transcriptional regulator [Myxococcota bacterium]